MAPSDIAPNADASPAQTHRWTGAYAGMNIGGAAGDSRHHFSNGNTTGSFGVGGVTDGLAAGYNWQFDDHVVLGLEGDFSAESLWGSAAHPNHNYDYKTQNPWTATLRPRLGYAFGDTLPYVTGGLAVGNVHSLARVRATDALGYDYARVEPGWVAGAGVEQALSPNWSVKAEYLYTQFAQADASITNSSAVQTSLYENIARVGLNYKLDSLFHPDTTASSFAASTDGPMTLGTLRGIELGGQLSSYRYQEHVVGDTEFMHETGVKPGITATATQALSQGAFVMADSRFAYSSNNYSSPGSGIQHHIPDYLGEIRLLAGKDFLFRQVFATEEDVDLSPYAGLGYRNLFNDSRGTASSGSHGYERDSQYLYFPMGTTARLRVTDNARLSANLEYDRLIEGWQTSDLSDFSTARRDITNGQYDGYGMRGSVMFEQARWSAGPFLNYWNIDKSSENPEAANLYGFEPHNQTIEYGIQARYRF